MDFVLLVTWFVYGSSPSSYQVVFHSKEVCENARLAVLREADRLNAELDQRIRERAGGGIGATYRQPKQVSATCAQLGESAREPTGL
jgi:hypothetical protein